MWAPSERVGAVGGWAVPLADGFAGSNCAEVWPVEAQKSYGFSVLQFSTSASVQVNSGWSPLTSME